MGDRATLLILILVLCHDVAVTKGYLWGKEAKEGPPSPDKLFLLQNSKSVAKTDAGEMRVLESNGGRISDRRLHIGFITMEPRSLFIPQYLDSGLIIFIRAGEAKLGFIYKDKLSERGLKMGDVYQIPAGSAFYLVNTGEGQTLHIICSIDPSESLGIGIFESFYIGGGVNPVSVLSGFEPEILETAFNASGAELRKFFMRQHEGPIVHVGDSGATSIWTKFLQLKEEDKLQHLKQMVPNQEERYDEEEDDEEEDQQQTIGSMMTPHVNPRATEYGIVLRGTGRIQIVFPNGSNAMDTQIKGGDVFFVPRYFPFCQIASRSGSLEFFGFTTSARKNKPQFLVGATSLLKTMMGPELAAAFGVSEETMRSVVNAQHEAVILPTPWAANADQNNKNKVESLPSIIKNDMIMNF